MKLPGSFLSCLGLLVSARSIEAALGVVQTADVYEQSDPFVWGLGPAVEAGVAVATLTRNEDGISLYLTTNNLNPGAYTLWYLIYNDPALCNNAGGNTIGECDGGADAMDSNIGGILRAAGDVVGESGDLTLVSWLSTGSAVGAAGSQLLPGSLSGGLTEPLTSEVHIILKWHGVALNGTTSPASLEAQLHDLQGGCGFYRVNGGMDPAPIQVELMGGPFELCPDLQAVVFEAASPTSSSPTASPTSSSPTRSAFFIAAMTSLGVAAGLTML